MSAAELPYWADDPAVMAVKADHRMILEPVEDTSVPWQVYGAACSCGDYVNSKRWDSNGHFEAFEGHMHDVQKAVHDTTKES